MIVASSLVGPMEIVESIVTLLGVDMGGHSLVSREESFYHGIISILTDRSHGLPARSHICGST